MKSFLRNPYFDYPVKEFSETLSAKPYLYGTNKGSSRVPRGRTFYGLVKNLSFYSVMLQMSVLLAEELIRLLWS
jgi:hypothetical protein